MKTKAYGFAERFRDLAREANKATDPKAELDRLGGRALIQEYLDGAVRLPRAFHRAILDIARTDLGMEV